MNVLITGIGICGKSTLRRKLVSALSKFGVPFFQYDADAFTTVRDARDTWSVLDPRDVPTILDRRDSLTIIEDVHAPQGHSGLRPLSTYDLIFYVMPVWWAYPLFWLTRAQRWFEKGKYSWKPKTGWKGTGKPRDWRNIPGIAKEMLRACWNRRRWIAEDLAVIYKTEIQVRIIKSRWTRRGPRFTYEF
ncbi:MAG: hypothetical protein UT32_C0017G0008 [Parcubacteria group bacterium GW2011_GWC2_39_14]|nr:MAG: hypothetical protein UT32_C0017G0008 [Parcubacteria group bacterium GW2011_GWC2_39_14]KKR54335.1 MAG: hypothetical protein UT91_C0018G0009 [Parcubacteria group bacterium GW2011_GWA2_40_23]